MAKFGGKNISNSDTRLALAILGGKAKNRNDPICVALPKVAKASKGGDITLRYHGCYDAELCQWKKTEYFKYTKNTFFFT